MAVNYWAEQMSRDVTEEEKRYAAELLDQQYADFIRSVLGNSPHPTNYLDTY